MSQFQPGDRVVVTAEGSASKGKTGSVLSSPHRPSGLYIVKLDGDRALLFFGNEIAVAPAPAGSAK